MHTPEPMSDADRLRRELMQLQAALRAPEPQAVWHIRRPVGAAELEQSVKKVQTAIGIGVVLLLGNVLTAYLNGLSDRAFFGSPTGAASALCLAVGLYALILHLPEQIRRKRIAEAETEFRLDAAKGRIWAASGNRLGWVIRFHSGRALPAFVLPPDADADLRRLRDEVQNRITRLSGLPFE